MRYRYLDRDDAPSLPLIVELPGGEIGEADGPPAAAALVLGPDKAPMYLDIEDEIAAWHVRVRHLEKTALMLHARSGVRVVVRDGAAGVLFDTAEARGDEDGEEETDAPGSPLEPVFLVPDTDRSFLRSLAAAGEIVLHEREDSFILRPHEAWDAVVEAGRFCAGCVFFYDGHAEGRCALFDCEKAPGDGQHCSGFAPVTPAWRGIEGPGDRYERVDPGAIPLTGPAPAGTGRG